jgi:periplasmic protein CpxP/Spy
VLLRQLLVILPLVMVGGSYLPLVAQAPTSTLQPANAASFTLAQAPNRARNQRMPGWLTELNLNASQVRRLRSVVGRYRPQISARTKSLRQAQSEMRSLMAGTASSAQIRSKHQQVEGLRRDVSGLNLENMLDIREILNLDQRRKFAEQMQNRRQQRQRQTNRLNSGGGSGL